MVREEEDEEITLPDNRRKEINLGIRFRSRIRFMSTIHDLSCKQLTLLQLKKQKMYHIQDNRIIST